MLELAISVAVPGAVASDALPHPLLDRSALVAHAKSVAMINHMTIGSLSELPDLGEFLCDLNSLLILLAKHAPEDGECLLKARNGLLVLLKVGIQAPNVVYNETAYSG